MDAESQQRQPLLEPNHRHSFTGAYYQFCLDPIECFLIIGWFIVVIELIVVLIGMVAQSITMNQLEPFLVMVGWEIFVIGLLHIAWKCKK